MVAFNAILITFLPLILWFILSLAWLLKSKKNFLVIDSIPTGFATAGVLGTFIGIAWGLQDFDVDNISESIPTLLSGLKQAFYTSIVGIGLSMIFAKIIEINFADKGVGESSESRVLREIAELLRFSNQASETSLARILEQQETMNTGLSNNTKQIIATLNDNNIELSTKIAEMNSRELLNAMEKSVEMFNVKMEDILQRLIKENFDELNRTVGQLNTWQEQNMDNMTHLIEQNSSVISKFESVSSLLETRFKAITEHLVNLTKEEGRLEKIVHELESVTLGDNQFQQIVKTTKDTIDELHTHTDTLEKYATGFKNTNEGLVLVASQLTEFKKLTDVNDEYWKGLKKGTAQLDANVDGFYAEFESNLRETFRKLDSLIQSIIVHYDNQNPR